MLQLWLIPGFYRCDDCGRLVDEPLQRTRRFRLCVECFERVVPKLDTIDRLMEGSAEHDAIRRYWEWYTDMEKRVPPRRSPAPSKRPSANPERTTDEYYPLCECGERKESYSFARPGVVAGLFGGPFLRECPGCRMRREVEWHVKAAVWLHPEWDDEEWLDLLYRVMPDAFEAGVLPDYWYELRKNRAEIDEKD